MVLFTTRTKDQIPVVHASSRIQDSLSSKPANANTFSKLCDLKY